MIEQLFGSKTRVKLLNLFFSNPNRSFYVREITRKIDEQINSVRRELANLLSIGLISSSTNNNRLYYEVNQDYEYFEPLTTIFGEGIATPAKKTPSNSTKKESPITAIGNVELALYTGYFTRDNSSGVDILIVGDINPTQLTKYISDIEAKEDQELTYAVMTPDDFNYRKEVNDRFITMILNSKKQVLVDKNNIVTTTKSNK